MTDLSVYLIFKFSQYKSANFVYCGKTQMVSVEPCIVEVLMNKITL